MLFALQSDAGAAAAGIVMVVAFFAFIAFFVLIQIAGMVLWIWMLVDCAQNEPKRADGNPVLWILLLVFFSYITALIYFCVRFKVPIAQQPMKGYQYPPQKPLY